MTTITVGKRGVITLPKKVREALGVEEGEVFSVRERDGSLVLKPYAREGDTVLSDIRAGIDEIRHGKFIEFGSVTELHKKMHAH